MIGSSAFYCLGIGAYALRSKLLPGDLTPTRTITLTLRTATPSGSLFQRPAQTLEPTPTQAEIVFPTRPAMATDVPAAADTPAPSATVEFTETVEPLPSAEPATPGPTETVVPTQSPEPSPSPTATEAPTPTETHTPHPERPTPIPLPLPTLRP
ncbi:MAG TPA: hypothetical protein PLG21_06340 [Anaerolineae bacterium]|nr:hypothetical protein [Anaerolineae bacterium]HPL27663.1 hypothetical protein [Anaerolineae bacterium]